MFQFLNRRAKRLSWIGFLLAAMFVMLGAGIYQHKTGPKHFAVVEEDVLYRSALLSPGNLEKVLSHYGIKTVVDLSVYQDPKREDRHLAEARTCRGKGVSWIPLSMPAGTPPTGKQVAQWLELLKDPENRPILVHCTHGVVRTGIMVAIYEMEIKKGGNRQVFSGLPTFGHDWDKEVQKFILNYAPRALARESAGQTTLDPV